MLINSINTVKTQSFGNVELAEKPLVVGKELTSAPDTFESIAGVSSEIKKTLNAFEDVGGVGSEIKKTLGAVENVSGISSEIKNTIVEEQNTYKAAILKGISNCGPISGLAENSFVQKIAGGIGSFFAFCTGASNATKKLTNPTAATANLAAEDKFAATAEAD